MTSDNNSEPVEQGEQGERPKIMQFVSGTLDKDKDHTDCHPDSPCQSGDDYKVVDAVGVRAVMVDGEKYLNRDDVLLILGRTHNAYMEVHQQSHDDAGPDAQAAMLSTFISAQTVNLIGAQLYRLTEGDGIDTSVPDTIPTDWLDGLSGTPAPESPIETAIRKAKEAALEAQRIKENGQ